jgi:uncharacterized Zn-finger protein
VRLLGHHSPARRAGCPLTAELRASSPCRRRSLGRWYHHGSWPKYPKAIATWPPNSRGRSCASVAQRNPKSLRRRKSSGKAFLWVRFLIRARLTHTRAHEAEKQYECSFCGNRFKNKNEAERHQNSLHVRRHSWSCAALKSYDRAFHDSTTRPGEADVCGYCGEEFARTGRGPDGTLVIGDQDHEERIRHLQDTHKFGECNPTKKFYRADHFRQHLKHSHAGTSGKWTNMLENACMIEEEPVTTR